MKAVHAEFKVLYISIFIKHHSQMQIYQILIPLKNVLVADHSVDRVIYTASSIIELLNEGHFKLKRNLILSGCFFFLYIFRLLPKRRSLLQADDFSDSSDFDKFRHSTQMQCWKNRLIGLDAVNFIQMNLKVIVYWELSIKYIFSYYMKYFI